MEENSEKHMRTIMMVTVRMVAMGNKLEKHTNTFMELTVRMVAMGNKSEKHTNTIMEVTFTMRAVEVATTKTKRPELDCTAMTKMAMCSLKCYLS